jgi:Leucine-rich repeat (LRR) protein
LKSSWSRKIISVFRFHQVYANAKSFRKYQWQTTILLETYQETLETYRCLSTYLVDAICYQGQCHALLLIYPGSIPYDICLARNLAQLAFYRNNLSGEIPNCIGKLASLRRIYLNSNGLSSTIPLTLWRLEDLVVLNLSSNSLKGSLPLQVGGMKAATAIYLSWNQLSGDIPSTVGSLQN